MSSMAVFHLSFPVELVLFGVDITQIQKPWDGSDTYVLVVQRDCDTTTWLALLAISPSPPSAPRGGRVKWVATNNNESPDAVKSACIEAYVSIVRIYVAKGKTRMVVPRGIGKELGNTEMGNVARDARVNLIYTIDSYEFL